MYFVKLKETNELYVGMEGKVGFVYFGVVDMKTWKPATLEEIFGKQEEQVFKGKSCSRAEKMRTCSDLYGEI